MKKFIELTILTAALAGACLAQNSKQPEKHNDLAKGKNMGKISERKTPVKVFEPAEIIDGVLKRGAAVGKAKKVSLAEVLKKPEAFAGKAVLVEGVIVRSCKTEGCWMELAPANEAKSVRVTFKDHAFFIPLDSAGMQAKTEGIFSVKTLSRAEVEHLVNEDGAKFDNINKDGTVTEISFEATGVELSKQTK